MLTGRSETRNEVRSTSSGVLGSSTAPAASHGVRSTWHEMRRNFVRRVTPRCARGTKQRRLARGAKACGLPVRVTRLRNRVPRCGDLWPVAELVGPPQLCCRHLRSRFCFSTRCRRWGVPRYTADPRLDWLAIFEAGEVTSNNIPARSQRGDSLAHSRER